jgi:hypothetical protein
MSNKWWKTTSAEQLAEYMFVTLLEIRNAIIRLKEMNRLQLKLMSDNKRSAKMKKVSKYKAIEAMEEKKEMKAKKKKVAKKVSKKK